MATFVLCHRHDATECRFVFAAWHGFDSPLRRGRALATCAAGGDEHLMFWTVEAADSPAALAFLPAYVARRTEAVRVTEVFVP
ncbi:hypothetical protein I6A84_26615 [Frankia sp. CNm7]|uniref:DUF3303 domain-containing protein n=1 Tax=Frankia nepalensis TaxID=1836974 RepID=A0A937RDB8_9ACTN|nr:hypothetical protein [Frankia nepalensis]MBL7497111.1 hypothetical protein [Frankia nepalensis]MBL7510783.1 hypothetical protein [Frankia nepalensis]MBL7521558.1 hypothetical protein [Frankia nepalensis]MBL7626794.1 hypothetical protein [Frankia nepalensis]